MKRSLVFFIFSTLVLCSQWAFAFDATSLVGTYSGKTPSFLGLFSKPCSLEITVDDGGDLTLTENDDKNTVEVDQVRGYLDAALSAGNRKIQFRKEHGDAFLGNFSDVTLQLDSSGGLTSAEVDQQDQAFIFLPVTHTQVSCQALAP